MLYSVHFIQAWACFLLTLSRFTLLGAPGDSSGVYLVIIPIHQHEHWGEGSRFIWAIDYLGTWTSKKLMSSR